MTLLGEKMAVLLIKPKVFRDAQKRLHREDGKAIEWKKDGSDYFFLHGINFEEELYWKIISNELKSTDMFQLTERQRYAAIKVWSSPSVK